MEDIRLHCLSKVLDADDRKMLQAISGYDFIRHDGTYDSIPEEAEQAIYGKMSADELEALFSKYGILGIREYDGKHSVDEAMPEPNIQLCIECKEPIGGAVALGSDGKWYWTYDMRLDIPCEFTVTHWQYL